MNGHLGENAELYALGALEPNDVVEVERHIASCDECTRRVAEAQDTVAQMITPLQPSFELDDRISAAFSPRRASKWTESGALIAAAFVVGLVPSMWFIANRAPVPSEQAHDTAVSALVEGHFTHAPFKPVTKDAPRAKMIFARQGTWRYFIAEPGRAYTVAVKQGTRTTQLGQLQVNGKSAELFVPTPPRGSEYLLLDGTRLVARLNLHT